MFGRRHERQVEELNADTGSDRRGNPFDARGPRRNDGPPGEDNSAWRIAAGGNGQHVERQPGPRCSADQAQARPTGATALSADDLRDLLVRLRADDYCQRNDLVDPITVLIATRLHRSELLALRWTDFDETKQTIAATGNAVRVLPRLLGSRRVPAVDGKTTVISPMHG
ncbi:hypothetical protein [Mycobacterium marinum]|uniref:hypothetical protein n=1 Tax=Mycobacterium marinum TaxID=1781 RepID=UPI0035625C80